MLAMSQQCTSSHHMQSSKVARPGLSARCTTSRGRRRSPGLGLGLGLALGLGFRCTTYRGRRRSPVGHVSRGRDRRFVTRAHSYILFVDWKLECRGYIECRADPYNMTRYQDKESSRVNYP
eukprot:scaffold74191_cov72-Phaeocystis_antarctica.AAC.3